MFESVVWVGCAVVGHNGDGTDSAMILEFFYLCDEGFYDGQDVGAMVADEHDDGGM